MQRRKNQFTLIELLVVIVIVIILMGMLIPVLSQARKPSYVATCRENLGQFGKSISMYRGDFEDNMPLWLSDLYRDYGVSKDLLLCPQDYSAGHDGGRPGGTGDKFVSEQYGDKDGVIHDSYPETDDTKRGDTYRSSAGLEIYKRQHEDTIEFCSYMYEFTGAEVPWDIPGLPSERRSWWEFKNWEFRNSEMEDGTAIQAYEFPVVRCVYHWGVMWGKREFVQNTAMDGSTFIGPSIWKKGRFD